MKIIWNHTYLLMILTVFAWSGNGIIARGLNDIIPPIGMAFWRFAFAIPLLLLIAYPHIRGDIGKLRGNWTVLAILANLSIVGYTVLVYQGLLSTTAINLFLINTVRPLIIVFLSFLLFRKAITVVQGLGFFLASLGTLVIIFRGDTANLSGLKFNSGDLWILGATVCWALYTVLLNKRPKIHSANFLILIVCLGVLTLFPMYVWETIYVRPTPFVIETIWAIIYLTIVSSVIAYLFYNRMVEIAGANKAGLISYLTPIVGSTLAILILGEKFEFFHALGFAMILSGIYFGSKSRVKSQL